MNHPLPPEFHLEVPEFKEPDWKRLYYAISNKLISARIYLDCGQPDRAKDQLHAGSKLYDRTEEILKPQDSMVLFISTPSHAES